MALFPSVRFEVLLPDGGITAGRTANGILVVTAEEAVARADSIELELVSTVRYQRPRLAEMVLYRTRRRVALPEGIVAGVHRFPFAIDTPATLPPSFHDPFVDIRHAVRVRMDVAWARDPEIDAYPKVFLAPRPGKRTPLSVRVPLELHDAEIELGIDSTVLVQGEPVLGFVRLPRGTLDPFQGMQLSLVSELTSVVAGKWLRTHASAIVTDEQLRGGEPVPFELPGAEVPSFQSGVLTHTVKIGIHTHGTSVTFRPATTLVPLEVLPKGSVIAGALEAGVDVRRRSARVAAATGLREGTGTVLVEGEPSGIRLRIRAVATKLGAEIEVELTCPRLAPGSDIFSANLPAPSDDIEIRSSDRTLVLCSRRANESVAELVALAQRAIDHAAILAKAIRSLPFPSNIAPEAADAWRACADATGAFLIPTVPSLDGLVIRRVLATQEERVFTTTLATAWVDDTPHDRVTLQLGAARLPERAMILLANGVFPEGLAAHRDIFRAISTSSSGGVLVLERDAWSPDPRKLLPALDAVIDWVMRERGEERSGSPYR